MKYIPGDRLKAEIERLYDIARDASYNGEVEGEMTAYDKILSIIASLQQEHEIIELSFKGGTYRVNGEENTFKGGKAKIIILEINQEEENV